ncbi:MAG: LPS export ABC transporter permease LptF [Deltaproteobacteria bacterium]|nr:LPS export ABC transporter permease LptF [Deltaproteobacteria bacterium]
MKRIIPLYIIKEILPAFFVSLLVLTFIMVLARILELTELVVVKGVRPGTILRFLLYGLPFSFSVTIPLSTLLAVLLAFLRLTGDNEIAVLKSAGVSLYRLLPPVILFCLWAYLVMSFLVLHLVPYSNRAYRNELLDLAKASADISIKERIFNSDFSRMVLYVNFIDLNEGWMRDIFIRDSRDSEMDNVVVASRGRIATDKKKRTLVFELFDGVIDRVEETISFDRYDLKLNLGSALSSQQLRPPDQFEMNQEDLWTAINGFEKDDIRYFTYRLEAYKRYSLPAACLVLGLIAVPLGLQGKNRGRNWGIIMGLGVFLLYYFLFTAGLSFGETGAYPPVLAMWMPNLIVGGAAIFLLRQANREMPIGIFSLIERLGSWLKSNGRTSEA